MQCNTSITIQLQLLQYNAIIICYYTVLKVWMDGFQALNFQYVLASVLILLRIILAEY